MAFAELDKLIDSNLTGHDRTIAKNAIRKGKEIAGAGRDVGDVALDLMGFGMRTNSKRMVLPATEQATMSPFARVNSAQMTPYIHSSPQLSAPISRDKSGSGILNDALTVSHIFGLGTPKGGARKGQPAGARLAYDDLEGGSIYPAGHTVHSLNRGGGFNPAGKGINPAGMRSGRGIYPAGKGINPAGMEGGAIYNPNNDPMIAAQNRRIAATMRHLRGGGFNPA